MTAENLDQYMQKWALTDPKPLAQTPTSHVYTVQYQGEMVVLKLLTPIGVKDEHNGAVALQCFDGKGAVRLLRHDDGAHLLEYAGDTDLVAMVKQGDDEKATAITAEVLNQLHTAHTGTAPQSLHRLERWFSGLFQQAETDKQADDGSIYVRAAQLARTLLDTPQNECILHGDIHQENIRHHPTRGWLAFDPKGLYGERTFDAANTLCNPDMPELVLDEARLLRNAEILATGMGIELSRLLQYTFAYACLSASWTLSDGETPTLALGVARLVEPHIT